MKINQNYNTLEKSYLFSRVAEKVAAYKQAHPEAEVISLVIGDVTRPLCRSAVRALISAAEDQGRAETFHGYGPEQGYPFLRRAIREYYGSFGVSVDEEEIFVSDGAKSDIGNILDLFSEENTVLIPDPVYPVYRDTNQMAGRKIVYMRATKENGFLPMPDPAVEADIIYLCSPNNPTGAVYTRRQLQKWVEYAKKRGAIILFDAAYESFIQEKSLPRSIFEIEDAKSCAIEFCSFSKTAGFTGTRCGYTVVPRRLLREGSSLRDMWMRRQSTKFNGVSYPVQKAAAAVLTNEGLAECRENLEVYRRNAKRITDTLDAMGIWHTGGKNSPYIWMECPNNMTSWDFFDDLLSRGAIVGTPGSGFGENGEGFFRLTSFGTEENTAKAMDRLRRLF